MLEREPRAGASSAALDFVEHQQPVILIADCAQSGEIVGMTYVDAAFALYQLDQHRGYAAIVGRYSADGFQIIERYAHETGEERLETRLRFAAAGCGQR